MKMFTLDSTSMEISLCLSSLFSPSVGICLQTEVGMKHAWRCLSSLFSPSVGICLQTEVGKLAKKGTTLYRGGVAHIEF